MGVAPADYRFVEPFSQRTGEPFGAFPVLRHILAV